MKYADLIEQHDLAVESVFLERAQKLQKADKLPKTADEMNGVLQEAMADANRVVKSQLQRLFGTGETKKILD